MTNSDRTTAGIESPPVTLTDFLLARITEDEEHAGSWYALHVDHDPQAWVLAECEAKRRIVADIHHRRGGDDWQADGCEGCGRGGPCDDYHVEHVDQCPTLRALALPYADHSDYRDEWRG